MGEQLAAFAGIVAAEIHCLAHFRHRIVDGLTPFRLQQRNEACRPLLQKIGGAFQR